MNRAVKTLAILAVLFLMLPACEKDESGNITITVSYYYNEYVGYKPDVGADAVIFSNEEVRCDDRVEVIMGEGSIGEQTYQADYTAEADVSGEIRFNDIPAGTYYLAISSKGRFTYSDKIITVPAGGELDLVKNFGYLHEFEREPW